MLKFIFAALCLASASAKAQEAVQSPDCEAIIKPAYTTYAEQARDSRIADECRAKAEKEHFKALMAKIDAAMKQALERCDQACFDAMAQELLADNPDLSALQFPNDVTDTTVTNK